MYCPFASFRSHRCQKRFSAKFKQAPFPPVAGSYSQQFFCRIFAGKAGCTMCLRAHFRRTEHPNCGVSQHLIFQLQTPLISNELQPV